MKLSILDASPIALGGDGPQAIRNSIDLARHADRLGFTRHWLTEHHGFPSEPSTAPEHLLPALLAATGRLRIGAGGILLNHYSPYKVAVNMRTLLALYPERLDIGIGRASASPGDHALKRHREAEDRDDRVEQLCELLRWLGNEPQPDPRLAGLSILPELPAGPSPWMLGASLKTALYAAENGLPLAFSGFINPQEAEAALQAYRHHFRPSPHRAGIAAPKALLAVRATVAETQEEAERLAMPVRVMMKLRREQRMFIDRLPSPEEAIAQWGGLVPAEPPPVSGGAWPGYVVGDAARMAETLATMAKLAGVDEIMMQDFIPYHDLRLRNYELVAKAFGLTD